MKNLIPNASTSKCTREKRYRFFKSPLFFPLLVVPVLFAATVQAADTEMIHSPPDYFVSDHRIQLEALVTDPAGIKLARCYFKAAGEADLVFVPMTSGGENKYTGILPAPSASTTQIEYLFLAVNNHHQVVRSQLFLIAKNTAKATPDWQNIPKEGEIRVGMELDQTPEKISGFSDNIAIDAVESTARFGVVALLYYSAADASSESALAAAHASTGASSAGGVAAVPAGYSTATIAGIGIGAAAVVGGTAAAIGSGGGGGGGDSDNTEALTAASILGSWRVTGNQAGYPIEGGFIFKNDGSFTFDNPTADGEWTLSGSTLIIFWRVAGGTTYIGTADGNAESFVFNSNDGGCNLNFSR